MKKRMKLLLAALIVLGSTTYSTELLNKNGYSMDLFGIYNVGLQSQSIKIDDYENTKSGIIEDDAWFQLSFKKELGKAEAGGLLRYGAGFETNTERNGGDMYLKYNVNDNVYVEYERHDFEYINYLSYTDVSGDWALEGKNLGGGHQLDLTPAGLIIDPVLSPVEVDFGVVFLGTGGAVMDDSGFVPDGALWEAHMAYRKNANDHDLKPSSFRFGYDKDGITVDTAVVYQNRTTTDASDDVEATNTGLTAKGSYVLNDKSTIGGGMSYGKGVSDYDTDSNDVTTTVAAQNIWYKTNLAGYDVFAELAHSNYETESDLGFSFNSLVEHQLGAEKSLNGAYVKVSKFIPDFGIPALEVKLAQSTFDKVAGSDYDNAQVNTLFEVKPSLTIPSKAAPMLMYSFSALIGKYDVENDGGVDGEDKDISQSRIIAGVTYIF